MIVTDSANCYKDLRVSKLEGKVGQKELSVKQRQWVEVKETSIPEGDLVKCPNFAKYEINPQP